MRGSFTVEAALLTPVILAVLFGVLTIAMVQHDKAVTMSSLDRCLVRTAGTVTIGQDWESGEIRYDDRLSRSLFYPLTGRKSAEEELTGEIRGYLSEDYRFLVGIRDVEVRVGLTQIQVTLYPELNGGFFARWILPEETWSKSIRLLHPEEMVRAFDGEELSTGESVPVEEELGEMLSEAARMEEEDVH